MFKVICISKVVQNKWPGKPPVVIEGNVYTVIDQGPAHRVTDYGIWVPDWYELAEDKGYVYDKNIFAPVSEIDEREFVRDYNKETV